LYSTASWSCSTDGRSNFPKLARGRTGTHYYAFDLLMVGDDDLRAERLHSRKAMLADLLDRCGESERLDFRQ